METVKPQISILMAVYEPRMDWLREQLESLNAQTYPNIKLYIQDDCSPTVPYEEIQSCVKDCIHAFPYEIKRNEKNLGSNGTFELLTREADGEYFAYCDQDDIWLPEKLERLYNSIIEESAELVCSDVTIIDGNGNHTADSMTQIRRHHVYHSGENLATKLVFHNWVIGCTMLVPAVNAKGAVPFCPYMVHDQYIALYCASVGKIKCVEEPLILYRIHGNNQTGIMTGVSSRESYIELRIQAVKKKLEWLKSNFPLIKDELGDCLTDGIRWAEARERNMKRKGGACIVWKYRSFGPKTALFEIFSPYMPEKLFLYAVELARQNVI